MATVLPFGMGSGPCHGADPARSGNRPYPDAFRRGEPVTGARRVLRAAFHASGRSREIRQGVLARPLPSDLAPHFTHFTGHPPAPREIRKRGNDRPTLPTSASTIAPRPRSLGS